MKYFSRKFIDGAMSENRRRGAIAAYATHLSKLQLSPALDTLSQLYLHDGLILAITHNPRVAVLQLRIRHGDLQVGYADVTLKFSQATIGEKSLQLLRDAVLPSNVDILAAELDAKGGCFKYRLLLWPKGEATLCFKNVMVKSHSVPSRSGS